MSQNEPAHFPINPLVELLNRAGQYNAEKGLPAGRSYAEGQAVNAGPQQLVSSAAAGRVRQLTSEERAERDRLAIEAGVKDESLMNTGDEENDLYPTLADALAAGEPVKRPEPMVARRMSVQAEELLPQYTSRALNSRPRLINFKNIESVDLRRGLAIVDGFEIDMPPSDLRAIKEHVLRLAVDFVTIQLTAALEEVMLGAPTFTGGSSNESSEEQEVAEDQEPGKTTQSIVLGGETAGTSADGSGHTVLDLRSPDLVPTEAGDLEARGDAREPESDSGPSDAGN
jgi:hypothetical protein